ncbi:MAG: hypothetical protein R3D33_18470 [Hyphomicrobiaceae bacterium]
MRVVAAHPRGRKAPGLDLELAEDAWSAVALDNPSHPQFRLASLLTAPGCRREDVRVLPGSKPASETAADRSLADRRGDAAARPADGATSPRRSRSLGRPRAHWHQRDRGRLAEEEAETVALLLRRAAESRAEPRRSSRPTAFARRVATRLESWNIRVDDSRPTSSPRPSPAHSSTPRL